MIVNIGNFRFLEKAETALDGWGAWRGFKGSVDLRDAVAAAIEREVTGERARCAAIAREWIHGSPTTTTETVVQSIAEMIENPQ